MLSLSEKLNGALPLLKVHHHTFTFLIARGSGAAPSPPPLFLSAAFVNSPSRRSSFARCLGGLLAQYFFACCLNTCVPQRRDAWASHSRCLSISVFCFTCIVFIVYSFQCLGVLLSRRFDILMFLCLHRASMCGLQGWKSSTKKSDFKSRETIVRLETAARPKGRIAKDEQN